MSERIIREVTCDRCGAVGQLHDQPKESQGWGAVVLIADKEQSGDLCPDCLLDFASFMDPGIERERRRVWPDRPVDLPKRTVEQYVEVPMPEPTTKPIYKRGKRKNRKAEDYREAFTAMWNAGDHITVIAQALGVTRSRAYQLRGVFGLERRPKEGHGAGKAERSYNTSLHRHAAKKPGRGLKLAPDHLAVLNSRTLFPNSVVDPADSPRLLVDGVNQSKIGGRVTKGAWKGMPIYCLTLEERATCPPSCTVWNECYGNNMHFARRHRHGPELEARLWEELAALNAKHATGFVVRLHVLGDFYSVEYAMLWGRALDAFPNLRVFGFTAHEIDDEDETGCEILGMNLEHTSRCRIRFSGTVDAGGMSAAVIASAEDADPRQVVCPVQTGATETCGTCALCWTMDKPVAFIAH